MLTDGTRVLAVLDWEEAKVGDALYDVANTRFWATHLACMRIQADYFDRVLGELPAYGDRVRCYALRIGLEEARSALRAGDRELAAWALRRCDELLEG